MKKDSLELKDIVSVGSDVASLLRIWRNSDGVRKQMINDHIISEDEHMRWLDSFRKSADKLGWVIFWGDRPAGFMQLTDIDRTKGSAEWGIYVGEEALRGRGIGKAALLRLLGISFGQLGLRRLTTKVLEGNEAASSLYRSVGFTEDGKSTPLFRDGRSIGVVVMSMSADAWRKIEKN